MDLTSHLEAILFATAEPMSIKELASLTGKNGSDVRQAAEALEAILRERGIVLLKNGDMLELRTHPSLKEVVERALEEPFTRSIGPAGAEVLSIVLYKGAVSRGEIEQIRGVNSGSVLRLLSVRGLIRKREGEGRFYEATEELLAHLGVVEASALPLYEETRERLRALEEMREVEAHADA
jgi:segregation and condensation protein B